MSPPRARVRAPPHRSAPAVRGLWLRPSRPRVRPASGVTRIPVLAGTRVTFLDAPEGTLLIRPPAPASPIADVRAAVRDALRFPLAGPPLEAGVPRGGGGPGVVEPAALPLPGVVHDPRRAALEAVVDALGRAGVSSERQTLLLAAGLARRPDRRQIDTFVSPELARRFHGRVVVHDAEADDRVDIGTSGHVGLHVTPTLTNADVVVVVSAAETVVNGGPAALVAATSPVALRAAGADSLLETGAAQGWKLGVDLERA